VSSLDGGGEMGLEEGEMGSNYVHVKICFNPIEFDVAVYERHACPQGVGIPKILISISATNPTYICCLPSFPMVSCMLNTPVH
jgi:hypothetical protein